MSTKLSTVEIVIRKNFLETETRKLQMLTDKIQNNVLSVDIKESKGEVANELLQLEKKIKKFATEFENLVNSTGQAMENALLAFEKADNKGKKMYEKKN